MADSNAQPTNPADNAVAKFIARWSKAEAAERANYQMFLTELCDLLGVDHPDPATADNAFNRYVFDRSIVSTRHDGTTATVYADLYKRGSFILETKQGANAKSAADSAQLGLINEDPAPYKTGHGVRGTAQWDRALERAYNQARGYIRDLPAHEGRPPFLIVCDVGYVIELYSEFTCTGGTYIRYPDPKTHRIHLDDLHDEKIRQRLRAVWTDPLSLDPSRHAARVTRNVAEHLSKLAASLEADGHSAQDIATFLQRCLFTMFAEDTGLLPPGAFIDLLNKLKDNPAGFAITAQNLWRDMATGTSWSVALMKEIAYFNGGLFENATALPLSSAQIALLIGAAKPDWSDVEPAIFGTLLERALSPRDRHKLGAHYTPRSYVERLVKPTIIDPLRARWDDAKTAAAQLDAAGDRPGALKLIKAYHHELCRITVLDPACGSGNFLYVTLEHMKRLEGEVLELLEALGDTELTFEMEQFKVRPQQFHGLEINAQAVAIAQLVLWIGYFQWHKKTTGRADTGDRPLLPKEQTIRAQDAVLAYDQQVPRRDADGNYVTIWDGRTTKPHPVTQREVPDESARIPVYDYTHPRRADWPRADYIVGNPPFIGASRMRDLLGDGYTEALRAAWKGDVPDSADFVMFWWEKAAALTRAGQARRFGFITTNSIHQTFNRRILEKHLGDPKTPLTVAYAIPDHPWVDSADGAAVRIAMTVATTDPVIGELNRVTEETEVENGEHRVELDTDLGKIAANLKIGADLTATVPLVANSTISNTGVKLHGSGFIVRPEEAAELLASSKENAPQVIYHYRHGRDLTQESRGVMVIDADSFTAESLRDFHPGVYQHVLSTVKPERDQNREPYRKENWWKFGRSNASLRKALFAPVPAMALIILVVAGPVFVIGLIAHRRKAKYKAEAHAPFTEQPLRSPGESLRLKIESIGESFDEILITLLMTGMVCLTLILLMPARLRIPVTLGAGGMALAIYIQSGRRLLKAQKELWNHRLGYDGERVVGEMLNQLMRDGFYVFHDLPFDDFNIDHVLVGPSGVYCVETKSRRKPAHLRGAAKARVVFDGTDLEYPWGKDRHGLIQVRRNAETLSKWLTKATGEPTPIKAILVLPGWFVVRKTVGDVNVLNEKEVARSFPSNVKDPLSADRIQRIVHQLSERCRIEQPA